MNKRKNNLDEMQEQKMLKIEHYGFWLAFWGLLAAILIQNFLCEENSPRNITGELIVLICISVYTLVSCLISGIWDRNLKPNLKTNVMISLISGFVCGMFFFFFSYYKYAKLAGSIATGIMLFLEIFVLTLGLLSLCAFIYKKRVKKLESEEE